MPKVTEGDVAPDVAAEVHEDGVEAGDGVEQLRHGIVGLDLDAVGVPVETEGRDEAAGEVRPVDVRIGDKVGIVVAYGAVDLTQKPYIGHLVPLAVEPMDHIGQLLAQGGGGRGLTMGAREHRLLRESVGQGTKRVYDLIHPGDQHLSASLAEHQGMGEVVDILGGAGEMDELAHRRELGMIGDALFDEVLHRLDVMVGGAFDVLDAARIRFRKPFRDSIQDIDRGPG